MDGNFFNIKSISDIKQNLFTEASILTEESAKSRLYDYDFIDKNKLSATEKENYQLDYQIKDKEEILTNLNGKIKNAQTYGTESEITKLKIEKQKIQDELYQLRSKKETNKSIIKELYSEKQHNSWINKTKQFVTKNILSKFSKKFQSVEFLGNSLQQLSQINHNVDELVSINIPVNESKANYEKLTQYLFQANKIHSVINKTIKNIKS